MDNALRAILACPQCHGALHLHQNRQWLVCPAERLAYPIRDGIPHLIGQEAISMPEYEIAPMDSASSDA